QRENQREPEERQRAVERMAEQRRARNAGNAVSAARDLLFIAHHEVDENVEAQCRERKIVVLHAQCREPERETEDETRGGGQRKHDQEWHSRLERNGGDVGADAVERRLSQRHLAGITDREVEAVRRHQCHAEQRAQVSAVALQQQRKQRECDNDDENRNFRDGGSRRPRPGNRDTGGGGPHTLRSSAFPRSPSGRTRITIRNRTSATPSLYAGET